MKVGINGFGRTGRLIFRALYTRYPEHPVAAINDIAPPEFCAYLLKHDSVHRPFPAEVSLSQEQGVPKISIPGYGKVAVFSAKHPKDIPWPDAKVDLAIEVTGRFTDAKEARAHQANTVVVAAPSNGADITIVMGINHENYDPKRHRVVSNASCTTNCAAFLIKVLDDNWGVEYALLSTVHAATNDQPVLDRAHRKSLRRSRAVLDNIIPTTTGAARTVEKVLKGLEGRLDGNAYRVPVRTVSIAEVVALTQRQPELDALKEAFKKAAGKSPYLGYTEEELVSSDLVRNEHSCVFDANLAMVKGRLVKVAGWYDNEWGYACRVADLVAHIAESQSREG